MRTCVRVRVVMGLGNGRLFMIAVTGPRTAVITCYTKVILCVCVCVCVCVCLCERESSFQRKLFVLGVVSLGLIMRQIKNVQAHSTKFL